MAVQYAVPIGDGTTSGWSVTGGGGNHWDAINNGINSGTPSLLDYIQSTASNSPIELQLTTGLTVPGTNTGWKLHLTVDGIDDPTVVVNFRLFETFSTATAIGPALNITQLTGGLGTTVEKEYSASAIEELTAFSTWTLEIWIPPSSPAQQVRIYEVEFEVPDATAVLAMTVPSVGVSSVTVPQPGLVQDSPIDISVGFVRASASILTPTSLVIDPAPALNTPPFQVERVECSSPEVVAS